MSQHDFDIANQEAIDARTDINNALKALASLSSGATAPTTTYANMLWYDTNTSTLKMRAEADDAWISIGYLDQSTDTFALFDDTKVVNSGGTQTGLLGDQTTAVWQAGTGTTESLVSPAKVKATAFPSESLSSTGHITLGGVKQQWGRVQVTGSEDQDFSISFDTSFSSSPWSIVTTIETETDVTGSFDLFEAVVKTKSVSGFTGRVGATTNSTYPDVYVNYLAIGPA